MKTSSSGKADGFLISDFRFGFPIWIYLCVFQLKGAASSKEREISDFRFGFLIWIYLGVLQLEGSASSKEREFSDLRFGFMIWICGRPRIARGLRQTASC